MPDSNAIELDVRPKIDSIFGLGNLIFGNLIEPKNAEVTLSNRQE